MAAHVHAMEHFRRLVSHFIHIYVSLIYIQYVIFGKVGILGFTMDSLQSASLVVFLLCSALILRIMIVC